MSDPERPDAASALPGAPEAGSPTLADLPGILARRAGGDAEGANPPATAPREQDDGVPPVGEVRAAEPPPSDPSPPVQPPPQPPPVRAGTPDPPVPREAPQWAAGGVGWNSPPPAPVLPGGPGGGVRGVRVIPTPVRPGGDLGRAELRRPAPLQAVRAAQAPQVAQVTRAREPGNGEDGGENVVLTIPWPAVPVSGDSDPRRRVPLGALLTGVVGELLITAGLLLGLYVVWEIVWSSVEAKPYQVAALEVIHERPGYVAPASDDAEYAPEYTENIPTVPGAAHGEAWVSLHVPRWGYGYDVAVAEGTDKYATLDKGLIGHYTSTQNPGELGNFAVAAHRITHGEPFAGIMELRVGDDLIVETDEYYLVYKMTDHSIVVPTDMSVIWPVPGQEGVEPARRLITLTTCHPRYTSTHRYIVVGEFEYWTKKTEGRLRALVPPGER